MDEDTSPGVLVALLLVLLGAVVKVTAWAVVVKTAQTDAACCSESVSERSLS